MCSMRAALLTLLAVTTSTVSGRLAAGDAGAGAATASASALSPVHPNDDSADTQRRSSSSASPGSALPSAIYDSSHDQALWLDRLNWLRSEGLVWEAADMAKLEWDFTLAEEARAAIKSCDRQPAETSGLHVFVDSASPVRPLDASLIEDAIQSWGVNELFGLVPELEIPTSSSGSGGPQQQIGTGLYNHYTQIVWSTTNRVGCAYTICSHGRLAACKYSPVGNTPGVGWYEHGAPCSKCPVTEAPICSSKLCADSNSSRTGGADAFTLAAVDSAGNLYQKHKIHALQLTLDAVVKLQQQQKAATNMVTALSDTEPATGTLCNDTGVNITQEQMSLLTIEGGLSPLAVVFGLFLGVAVILVMIVCIMHATKPKKNRPQDKDKDHDDDRVQVI